MRDDPVTRPVPPEQVRHVFPRRFGVFHEKPALRSAVMCTARRQGPGRRDTDASLAVSPVWWRDASSPAARVQPGDSVSVLPFAGPRKGTSKKNLLPCQGTLSTPIEPLMASTSSLLMANPRPFPP